MYIYIYIYSALANHPEIGFHLSTLKCTSLAKCSLQYPGTLKKSAPFPEHQVWAARLSTKKTSSLKKSSPFPEHWLKSLSLSSAQLGSAQVGSARRGPVRLRSARN